MRFKKSIIFIFLVICFLSIVGVCANDTGEGDIQTGNGTLEDVVALDVNSHDNDDVVALDVNSHDNDDVVESQEETGHDTVASSDENDELSAATTFLALQGLVTANRPGHVLNLTLDFSMIVGGDTVKINKNITIDGHGHTLNGDNLKTIFSIDADGLNITLKNINFINGGTSDFDYDNEKGGAISNPYSNTVLNIINCGFSHNGAKKYGGAIYSMGNLSIVDSRFYRNVAESGNGGAVFCNAYMFINNTKFDNNVVKESSVLGNIINGVYSTINYLGEHNAGAEEYEKQIKVLETEIADLEYVYHNHHLSNKERDDILGKYGIYTTYYDWKERTAHLIKSCKEDLEKYRNGADTAMTGGAVYCLKECTVYNSFFDGNIVGINHDQIGTSGGAIHCRDNLHVYNSTFRENSVNDWGGGAIFCEKNCHVYNSTFEDNTANKGCAIYCWGVTNVTNSKFSYNVHIEDSTWLENKEYVKSVLSKIVGTIPVIGSILSFTVDKMDNTATKLFFPSEGGAIWSGGKCIIKSCIFDNNRAMEHGGAIYSKSDLEISGQNAFYNNKAYRKSWGFYDKLGGAIFCEGNLLINGSSFYYNHAGVNGGAIYCSKQSTIIDSNFINNRAFRSDLLKMKSCYGGAIYTKDLGSITNCTFKNNHVGDVKSSNPIFNDCGGAIYVEKNCNNAKFISCSFQENSAKHEGGAIFIESPGANYDVILCEFSDNHVRDEGGAIYSRGIGHIQNSSFTGQYVSQKGCGGAIYSEVEITLDYSIFTKNHVNSDYGSGGALYGSGKTSISYCNFTDNNAKTGGAVFTIRETKLSNSYFSGNSAEGGGAVYANLPVDSTSPILLMAVTVTNDMSDGDYILTSEEPIEVYNSVFNDNKATSGDGGAIYVHGLIMFSNSNFTGNTANEGGAIYATFIRNNCNFSSFIRNKATSGSGGAIFIKDKCCAYLHSCNFNENSANRKKYGGAIYMDDKKSSLELIDSQLVNNSAKEGGAVYVYHLINSLDHDVFIGNKATSGDGGAVYVINKCDFGITNSIFNDNTCTNHGGGIYLKSNGKLKITKSSFNDNSANQGGAVYAHVITSVSESLFFKNKATLKNADGGAIYIADRCNPEFVSCRFEGNIADNRGGAIYTNKIGTDVKVSYCTFIDNHAYKKNYNNRLVRNSAGHSIFNSGHYDGTYSVVNCWFGTNTPDFTEQFAIWESGVNDKDLTPKNPLKIVMTLNESEIHADNPYKVTINFQPDLKKDLFHSDAKFWGDGEFSNFKLGNKNEMAADVIFDGGTPTIYGKLDYCQLSLKFNAMIKSQSEVRIISCDDIKYPNQLKVSYEILNMSDISSFVIKDIHGEIVKQGNLTGPDTLLVDGLKPGSYSITIINHESRRYSASSANATFNVSKGDIDLMIIVFNETYPDEVECIIPTSVDGKYVLSVGTSSWEVIVKNNVAHFNIGVLDAGNYNATISFTGDDLYNPCSNSTTFTVTREGTSFEIDAVPSIITYGESVKIIPIFGDAVNGTVIYRIYNGKSIAELPAGENLTLSDLNVGAYTIIAIYSGDNDHEPALDSAHVLVHKAQPAFSLEAGQVIYGDNVTVTHMLPDVARGSIKYYWKNGTFIGELQVNENLTLPVLDTGAYVIIAEYSGDDNLLNATANTTLIVNKAMTQITAYPVITTYKDDDYLLIALKNNKEEVLVGVNVTVYLNGAKNYTTDENGEIYVSTGNLGADSYDVLFSFNGTGNYLNCSNATQIFVNTRPSQMTTSPLTTIYQIHKYLVVNLKDDLGNPITDTNVFLTVHGITYQDTTDDKGDARLIIRLNPMEYIGTLTFDNNNYTMSLEFVKITVLKATPKIIAKNKKFKVKTKVKKYTVVLKDNIGKAIGKVMVTLKIKGKTYKVTTDANGKATFKIKNLKKKGKFKAKVTFEGNIYFNKVTKNVKIISK